MLKLLLAFTLTISSSVYANQLSDEQYEQARKYIVECATDWAHSVVTGDMSKRKIYFAEDFQGTGIDGSRYAKSAVIREEAASDYVSNEINNIDVRFFGTTAIAYGDETWTMKDGSSGRWIWTDIWLYRNDEWQVVAAQDVEVLQ